VYVKEGEFVERDPEVTFMNKLKVNYIDGQVVDTPELWSNTSGKVKIDPDPEQPNDEVSFAIDDYEGLLGHNVRVWYKGSSKVLGVEVLSTEKVLTAKEYRNIKEPPLIFINFIKHEGSEINVADADEIVVVYYGSNPIAVKAVKYKVGVITDIYSYGKRMDVYLEYLEENETKIDTLRLYDFDVEYVGVDGFDDLKEGDTLHYIYYDNENRKALIIVAGDVVKGTLTEITYDNKIKVDGKTFSAVDETIVDKLKEEVNKDGKVVVTLYLDKDGKVFHYKSEPEPAPKNEVYGVVQAIAVRVVDKEPRTFHKVLTLEGEVEYIFAGGTEGNLNVGDVIKITRNGNGQGGVTYTYEKLSQKQTGTVEQRTENTIKFYGGNGGNGAEYTYDENTLWVEGQAGKYVERPLPYKDDTVTLYLDDGNNVAVGIVGIIE